MRIFLTLFGVIGLLLLSSCRTNVVQSTDRSHVGPASRDAVSQMIERGPAGRSVFKTYRSSGQSYWGANWTSRIDLSGVAWDKKQAGVLISPRHVLFADHYQRPLGSSLVFHDRDGKPHVRRLEKVVRVRGNLNPDIAMGLLDQAVPVRFYRVLPAGSDWHDHLKDGTALLTNRRRAITLHKIGGIAWRQVVFAGPALDVPKGYHEMVAPGDSGHPTFLLYRGEPVLISTHALGGKAGIGPFFSAPENIRDINLAMKALGGNHQLQTVPVAE